VHKRLVTSYATKSAAAADENQRAIEAVFAELEASRPETVSYLVLRLDDNSFVHVSFHDHGDDVVNPITSAKAFGEFRAGLEDRRSSDISQHSATLVGAYLKEIE
jgi:hypothetical protein